MRLCRTCSTLRLLLQETDGATEKPEASADGAEAMDETEGPEGNAASEEKAKEAPEKKEKSETKEKKEKKVCRPPGDWTCAIWRVPAARARIGRGGGCPPPPPSRAPTLRPATVSLTPSAILDNICNRQ